MQTDDLEIFRYGDRTPLNLNANELLNAREIFAEYRNPLSRVVYDGFHPGRFFISPFDRDLQYPRYYHNTAYNFYDVTQNEFVRSHPPFPVDYGLTFL